MNVYPKLPDDVHQYRSSRVFKNENVKAMKRIILLSALSFCLTGPLFAQDVNVPSTVTNVFTKDYPDATKVTWTKEKDNYEVNFVQNKKETTIEYTPKGDLVEIETYVAVTTLPQPAFDYMKDNYRNKYIKMNATKITKANGDVYYSANVKRTDVLFDANGRFVRTE
jgi:hypothetical protein